MTLKNTFGWGQSVTVAKYGAAAVLLASTGMVLLSGSTASDPAPSKLECPKVEPSNDPFGEFDDVMTEDEKREALHEDLKQKLASHKASCDPLKKTRSAPAPAAQQQAKQAGASGGEQGGRQASGQNSGGQANASGQAGSAQNTPKGGEPSQNAPSQNVSSQSEQVQSEQTQGTAGNGGTYSSPWAKQPEQESGVVSLEPRAETKNTSAPATNAATSEQINSQAAPGVSGAAPAPNATDAAQGQGQPSKFLEKYGGAVQAPQESITDIANRHKNSGSGSPGNTGTLQKNQRNGAPGSAPRKTSTISANDAAIKALEERLERETDPEKKKQIQAEIDRLKK